MNSVAATRGERPLVVGMDKYRIASSLAFYRNKIDHSASSPHKSSVQETTGRQLFGMDALMYNFWLSPADATARDILVISERKEYIADHLFVNKAQQLSEIHNYLPSKNGKEVGSYFYQLITQYTPAGPANTINPVSTAAISMKTPRAMTVSRETPGIFL